jgi:hypothetical protein
MESWSEKTEQGEVADSSLVEVSKELGHSTNDITFRTHYKLLPNESRSDINELDGKVEAAQESATPIRT